MDPLRNNIGVPCVYTIFTLYLHGPNGLSYRVMYLYPYPLALKSVSTYWVLGHFDHNLFEQLSP